MAAQSNCYFSSSNCPCRFLPNRNLGTPSFRRLRNWSRKGCVELGRRRLRLVNAQLPTSLSINIGLDSQGICSDDSSQFPWVGPLPGDIAEVEAYCRIFRAAEQFHDAMMDVLCNQLTGVHSVLNDSRDDKPLLADKIISILGCMVCLLNKGKDDVLSGRLSIMKSFRDLSRSVMDDNLPPLATFRCEMKSYCESLHGAVEKFFTPGDDQISNVWRKLQRLKNVCYDSGFPRQDDHPCQTLLANWSPVPMSPSREGVLSENSEIAFWKGGQVTEESLKWLLGKGFRTIIDLRAESVKDIFYETALHEAVSSGKIELIKLPVEIGAMPSVEQVVQFYAVVSDSSKTPIYVHSKEGKRRTFAMISRWRRYMHHITSITKQISTSDLRAQDTLALEGSDFPTDFEDGELMDQDPPDTEYQSLTTDGADNTLITNQGTDIISVDSAMGSTFDSCEDVKPMESQLPPPDILSRKDMPKLLEDKSMSSLTHFSCEHTRLNMLSKLSCNAKNNMNGSLGSMESSKAQDMAITNRSCQDPSVIFGPATHLHKSSSAGDYDWKTEKSYINSNNDPDQNATSIMVTGQDSTDVKNYISEDETLDMIERSMCSSTTGVVRVQSRMKAEMFLVRADEFSCISEKVRESSLAFTHPSTQQQMLLWKYAPRTVLVLKKLGRELLEEAKEVASFLYYQEKMNILVEPEVHEVFSKIPGFGFVQTFYSPDISDLHERVDLVACLGGDGVILHASTLFRGSVPPVVSFHLGSLGFLTSHTFDNYKKDLQQVIRGNNASDGVYVTLRMRLCCEIYRKGKAMPGKIFSVLNEVVVDRGSNPYLSKIECYDHDHLITKVQGDGVIIATPTGSTAYSSSAGGSMVHPNVPCMLFTPICPHSLSFRPIILPDSAQLELKIPEDARSNAWVSFDGKRRQQLSRGDSVKISMSQHPLPTVNNSDQTGDWFGSLIRCLNWNERQDQKAM